MKHRGAHFFALRNSCQAGMSGACVRHAQTPIIATSAKGMTHYAFFPEETVIQLHGIGPQGITYVNPADDPRKK
jgi:hypothetical protein